MKPARLLLLAAVALLLAPATATADCQMAGPPADELPRARVAFVGTATAINGTATTFAVAEVWRGELGPTVQVRGAFDDGSFGEDDRSFEIGTTYLVLPYVDGGALRDTICSATTAWTDDLAALRPADARLLTANRSAGPTLLLAGIGLVVVLFAAISWIAFRRPRG
jgi:hypothetical protein